jgi:predicted SAM-dependent methyltransferase
MFGLLTRLRRYRWYLLGRYKLRREIRNHINAGRPLKIILGSSITGFKEWLSTDLPHFDITRQEDWAYLFEEGTIDNLLAEHVFEHLTLSQAKNALLNIRKYLKRSGVFRIAVPDGYHFSPEYIDYCRPGGSGPGCDDHKLLWNMDLLNKTAQECGLKINLLQFYNSNHDFTDSYQDDENGTIGRTYAKMQINQSTPFAISSLIADLRIV